jgi:hypothetical protein
MCFFTVHAHKTFYAMTNFYSAFPKANNLQILRIGLLSFTVSENCKEGI